MVKVSTDRKVWFTSDIHFGHKAILSFCPERINKYGETVSEMNENIITDWNKIVQPDDLVFILGDVSFASITDTAEILSRLNGELHLISGNHDQKYLDKKLFTVWFKSIQPYLEIQVAQQKICMFHYPQLEWNSCHWGTWMLHGHLHGKPTELQKKYKTIDVGIDATGKTLISFEEVQKIMETKINLKHGDGSQGL